MLFMAETQNNIIYPEIVDVMIRVYDIENFEFNENEGLYPFIFLINQRFLINGIIMKL